MKYAFLSFVFLTQTAILTAKSLVDPHTKRGLIIAIGNYPAAGGWSKISSADDIPLVEKMLYNQGFLKQNVAVVKDSIATRKGIETALKKLIADVNNGDIVVIHVSSHGEQIEDNNGDEPDGLDETIVAYDAIAPAKIKNLSTDTGGYLRDDVFGSYINQLRKKLGPKGDVVVFLDACHSGSGTRGVSKIRGGQAPIVSAAFKKEKFQSSDTAGVFKETNLKTDIDLASYIIFSAARAEEYDYEILGENGKGIGSLTYAVCKAMEELGSNLTYQTLFSKIQGVLNIKVHNQHPVMEGSGTNRQLFGGDFVKQKLFFQIDKINKKEATIGAGKFAGFDVGAVVGLYPVGTTAVEKGKALDTGTVITAGNNVCTVKLKKGGITNPADAWVFVLEPVYNLKPLVIQPYPTKTKATPVGFSEKEIKTMRDSLKTQTLISFQGLPDLLVKKGNLIDTLDIASSGYPFAIIDHKNYYGSLSAALQHFSQYRFLEELQIVDTNLKVELTLVPIVNGKPDYNAIPLKNKNGTQVFKNGDKFVLSVTNPGRQNVYINILDMQPDGVINPVLPNKKKNIYPDSLLVRAGQTKVFKAYTITVGPPYGDEIFKIFVSHTSLDLEYLVTTRGENTRGNLNILEKIVKRSYETKRGGPTTIRKNSNADGAVQEVIFEIVR